MKTRREKRMTLLVLMLAIGPAGFFGSKLIPERNELVDEMRSPR